MDNTLINTIGYMERTVSFDLFPLHERYLTKEWAKQTYRYFYLFDGTILTTTYKNGNDLGRWIKQSRSIMREIKIMGTQAGRDEVVQLAANTYNLTLPDKNKHSHFPSQKPINVHEVIAIISNPDWYFDDKKTKQNIIHHLVYGLTRKNNNLWLQFAEKNWLKKYNISYDYSRCNRVTETRGFVYKLMNSTFSNTIIKMFKRAMETNLGEYISVRDNEGIVNKIQSGVITNLSFERVQFTNGKGIIFSKINNSAEHHSSMDGTFNPANWVLDCKKKGMSIDQICNLVTYFYTEKEELSISPQKSMIFTEWTNESGTFLLFQIFLYCS